jgi:hypothetical protein
MREWMYRSTILDLGSSWIKVVSFTPRPLYTRGNILRFPLDRRLAGPQTTWRRENSCLYQDPNSDPSAVQPVASRYLDCI